MKITRELLENSIKENEDFIEMVCENKYNQKNHKDIIENVISYCKITNEKQKELLRSGKFIPAGSILSACNNESKSSFSNCYYIPILKDSIESIYEAHSKIARTFSYRGGVGTDITILRPANDKVENTSKTSSGAVSFIPSFAEVTKTIGQNGRRGALLISLDIRHPDIMRFIDIKSKPENVFETDIFSNIMPDISSANITIKITNAFMEAVEKDEDWTFWFPDIQKDKERYNREWDGDYDKWGGEIKLYQTIKARDILDKIVESNHICGDPGIAFMDNVQNNTMGRFVVDTLKPTGFNACGEEPMAPWESCLLGAFVLHKYVINPFKANAHFNYPEFQKDIGIATEIMNIFSDMNENKHPLKEQRDADKFSKRIGIEMTGIGDMFAMLGMVYGDSNSIVKIKKITKTLLLGEIKTSLDIAKIKGCCPAFIENDRNAFVKKFRTFLGNMGDDIIIYGLANTSFNTIGPCGTISIISDNCSSGIEPIFKFSYKRKNRVDNKEYEFIHYLACKHMLENFDDFDGLSLEESKELLCYQEAGEIDSEDRIKLQSAAQFYIDTSISSTINLKNDATKEEIKDIILNAYKKDLKGITIFRDGCKDSVFSSIEPKKVKSDNDSQEMLMKKELFDKEQSFRHRVVWKKSKLYINVSVDDGDNPIEIFTKLPKAAGINGDGSFDLGVWQERTSNWDLSCRLISMCLRYNIPLVEVIEQLEKSSYTMVDAGSVLKRILSYYVGTENNSTSICKSCGENTYYHEGGCGICKACGFSECS